jgi:hypothetical protein
VRVCHTNLMSALKKADDSGTADSGGQADDAVVVL